MSDEPQDLLEEQVLDEELGDELGEESEERRDSQEGAETKAAAKEEDLKTVDFDELSVDELTK